MTWNYRIIKDGDYYSVCEVFYESKKAVGWSDPITIGGESVEDILKQLEMITQDIKNEILEVNGDTLVASKE